ncbi:MAG: alpha/beta hydrolase [Planctomycetaceae bacterium]
MSLEDWPLLHRLVYHPRRGRVVDPHLLGMRDLEFTAVRTPAAAGPPLAGWVVGPRPAPGTGNGPGRPGGQRLVVYFPGRGGHRGFRLPELRMLAASGAQTLLCDYRGYAENPGHPSEQGLAQDARAIWRFATDSLGWPAQQLLFYGESLGGAVAVRLAVELQQANLGPRGLILRSTFPSLAAVARHNHPWLRWLIPRRWYPSDQLFHQLRCPVLQLHGADDRLVPLALALDLWGLGPHHSPAWRHSRFVTLPHCGHNDPPLVAPAAMRAAIAAFLESLDSAVAQAPVA